MSITRFGIQYKYAYNGCNIRDEILTSAQIIVSQ